MNSFDARALVCELGTADMECVSGGSFGEAVLAGVGGVSASRAFIAIAGVTTGPVGASIATLAGFAGGVALYYLTD